MKIAYNPLSSPALSAAPAGSDIIFDLPGINIYAKGVRFKGTDTTYNVFKKHTSSGSGGYNGLVPVPSYTTTSIRYLREDGTWQVPQVISLTYTLLSNEDFNTLMGEGRWYFIPGSSTTTNGPSGVNSGAELYVGRNSRGYRYQKVITASGIVWFRYWNATAWQPWVRWYTDANTDNSVLQSVSTTANFRPLIIGYTNSVDPASLTATVTNLVYTANAIYALPSTATLFARIFDGDLRGNADTSTSLGNVNVGNAALPVYFAAGKPVACVASSLFSVLTNDNKLLSVTVAGQNRKLTISYASVAERTNALQCFDIRSTTPLPKDKLSNAVTSWFNLTGTPDTGWWGGLTVKGWSGEYEAWEIAGPATNINSLRGFFLRSGAQSTWNPWERILTSANSSLTATTNDITIKINNVTATLPTEGSNDGRYLKKAGDTILGIGQLSRIGNSVSWIKGREGAIIRLTSYTGYNPIFSAKTTNGDWSVGPYTDNILYFSYCIDTNYATSNNSTTAQIYFRPDGTILNPFVYLGQSVGIGTGSPTEKLHIKDGNVKIENTTPILEFWRGTNSSWRFVNSNGTIYIQNNYTSSGVGAYFNVLQLDYNSGNARFKNYVSGTYFYSAITNESLSDIGSVYVSNTTDNYIRKVSKAQFQNIITGKFVTLDTTLTISGVKTFTTLQKFNVSLGTSPFIVSSSTLVANLNSDLLDNYHLSDILPNSIYHATLGSLVTTDISSASDSMITVNITGNSYGAGMVINTILLFYNYDSGNYIGFATATHFGFNFGTFKIFNYNGKVCFWFKLTRSYLSYTVTARVTNSSVQYNRVTTITDVEMPTTGVTRLISVTPYQAGNLNPENYVTALGTSGNFLTWTRNGTVNNILVPYAERAGQLSSYAQSPNNSYPGYGARIFYSWDMGQSNNATAGYSNGITIGSYPGDANYGFLIVQNMWDDRTYTRRYNIFWQSWKTLAWTSDILDPANYYWANIRISASSSTDTSPQFSAAYATNWFRTYGQCGWYSLDYGGGIHQTNSDAVSIYGDKLLYNDGYRVWGIGGHNCGLKLYQAYHIGINLANASYTWGIYSNKNGNMYIGRRNGNVNDSSGSYYHILTTSNIQSPGFYHTAVGSDNYALLAGGGYKALTEMAVPIGTIIMYLGSDTPTGWEDITYMFAGRFPMGVGTTKSNLGMYPGIIPSDLNATLNSTGGQSYSTMDADYLPAHYHRFVNGSNNYDYGTYVNESNDNEFRRILHINTWKKAGHDTGETTNLGIYRTGFNCNSSGYTGYHNGQTFSYFSLVPLFRAVRFLRKL